ncbi:hypothetical protein [Paenibacillus arenilitoris]|uniref:Uncharacterized protein n=1 Tax=Paenibacillus arenilitoris TaxID=2772299 RepID=A0A927CNT8_9BACL|nr:hypothetical protein [Paenibacillus arenilitoris]MBD2869216.1 hypothetical protein [Paenibacillus arenilitoris]
MLSRQGHHLQKRRNDHYRKRRIDHDELHHDIRQWLGFRIVRRIGELRQFRIDRILYAHADRLRGNTGLVHPHAGRFWGIAGSCQPYAGRFGGIAGSGQPHPLAQAAWREATPPPQIIAFKADRTELLPGKELSLMAPAISLHLEKW